MPPKTKKQLEEEARRLQQQRKKKQEQDRILEQQRKKYAAETLSTGLLLPCTSLFIKQFKHKPLSHSQQIIRNFLNTKFESIKTLNENLLHFIILEICNNVRWAIQNWDIENKIEGVQHANLQRARVFIGIMFTIFTNKHPLLSGQNKIKQQDFNYFKKLVISHSTDDTHSLQIFDRSSIQKIVTYAQNTYFGHYELIHSWWKFTKREQIKHSRIHVDIPSIVLNNKNTTFVDLSGQSK